MANGNGPNEDIVGRQQDENDWDRRVERIINMLTERLSNIFKPDEQLGTLNDIKELLEQHKELLERALIFRTIVVRPTIVLPEELVERLSRAVSQARQTTIRLPTIRVADFPILERVQQALRVIGRPIAAIQSLGNSLVSMFGTSYGVLRRVVGILNRMLDLILLPMELIMTAFVLPFLILYMQAIAPLLIPTLRAINRFVEWMMAGGFRVIIGSGILAPLVAAIATIFAPLSPILAPLLVFASIIMTLSMVIREMINIYQRLRQYIGSVGAAFATLAVAITQIVAVVRAWSLIQRVASSMLSIFGSSLGVATANVLRFAISMALASGIVGLITFIAGTILTQAIGRQYQQGGYVPATGWYYLHAGEHVVPASSNTQQQPIFNITVNVNAEVSSDVDIDEMGRRLVDRIMDEIRLRLRSI